MSRKIRVLPSDPRHATFRARAEAEAQAERARKLPPAPKCPAWLDEETREKLLQLRKDLA